MHRRSPRSNTRLAVCLCLLGLIAANGFASEQTDEVAADVEATFKIPAQALDRALADFAIQSGLQVLYDSRLVADFASHAVEGRMPVRTALRMLLRDTALAARFTARSSVTLVADDEAIVLDTLRVEDEWSLEERQSFDRYARIVQASVSAILGREAKEARSYQADLRLWIDDRGVITAADLARSKGNDSFDQDMSVLLHSRPLREPPPANMPQPIRIRIKVQSFGE